MKKQKKDTKQMLFEMMGKINPDYKKPINEEFYGDDGDELTTEEEVIGSFMYHARAGNLQVPSPNVSSSNHNSGTANFSLTIRYREDFSGTVKTNYNLVKSENGVVPEFELINFTVYYTPDGYDDESDRDISVSNSPDLDNLFEKHYAQFQKSLVWYFNNTSGKAYLRTNKSGVIDDEGKEWFNDFNEWVDGLLRLHPFLQKDLDGIEPDFHEKMKELYNNQKSIKKYLEEIGVKSFYRHEHSAYTWSFGNDNSINMHAGGENVGYWRETRKDGWVRTKENRKTVLNPVTGTVWA